nr:HpaII family restriction endonuclease [Changchengzhania lutea]
MTLSSYFFKTFRTLLINNRGINIIVGETNPILISAKNFGNTILRNEYIQFDDKLNTNITFKIIEDNNLPISDDDLIEVNSITKGHKYIKRISKLAELGYQVNFDSFDDDTFKLNLQVIDSDLPEIVAHIVKISMLVV